MKTTVVALLGLFAAGQTPSPAPSATYKTEAQLLGALAAGATTPDMLTSAVANDDHHRINIVRRTKAAGAIEHPGFAELHHIIEGSGTLVTGGTIMPPAGGRGGAGATIQNGETRHVTKGDVILVPSGMPNWYKDLDGTQTYLEVRFAEK